MAFSISAFSNKIKIKFTYGKPHNNKVYEQPLFYLAENYRQMALNNSQDEIENKKIDKNLIILGKPNLQIETSINNNSKDVRILYSLNQFDNKFNFTYKSMLFEFSALDCNITNKIKIDHDIAQVYSEYEISFENQYYNEFEDFIKTCLLYYDLYYHCSNTSKDKISIYLTSPDGRYFQYLGKRQKRDIDSLYLPKKQKNDIIADIEKFLDSATRAKYIKLGINHKRIYLLEGIPGSGKTSLITALASKFNFNIAIISFIPKMTDVDLLRLLRSLNETYEESATHSDSEKKQTIMIFEDIDCIFQERKSHDENKNSITFSGLLNALDGITSNENLICFITTNYKNHLDSALLRPGRIDYIMRFDYSTKEQIQDMYRDFTNCQDDNKILNFYKVCASLQINISTALLQQYLIQYINMPDEAISNIEHMKKIFDSAKVDKAANDSNLYS